MHRTVDSQLSSSCKIPVLCYRLWNSGMYYGILKNAREFCGSIITNAACCRIQRICITEMTSVFLVPAQPGYLKSSRKMVLVLVMPLKPTLRQRHYASVPSFVRPVPNIILLLRKHTQLILMTVARGDHQHEQFK